MHVTVGAASGLGNTIFLLPLLYRLHEAEHEVSLFVDADYPLAGLWRRCRYLNRVAEHEPVPPAQHYVAGHWCPQRMVAQNRPLTRRYWLHEPHYPYGEWVLAMEAGRDAGLITDTSLPDVSDWCTGLDRTPRWDVGLIAGCKPGSLWARKRYPHLAIVAGYLIERGLTVAAFGLREDWPAGVPPGVVDLVDRFDAARLPDALAGCRAIVGTDSGPAHLAASLGVPTVMLYTATSPTKGQPVGPRYDQRYLSLPCSPCQATARWQACADWRCQQLDAQQIVEAVTQWL